LIFGGYDTSRFINDTLIEVSRSFSDQESGNTFTKPNITLQVLGADVLIDKKSIRSSYASNQIAKINLDSTRPTTVLPLYFCSVFLEEGLGLHVDNTSGLYLIDVETHQKLVKKNPTFRFNVTTPNYYEWDSARTTSINIDFSYQEMLLNKTYPSLGFNTYYIPIQCSTNFNEYAFGRAFMQKVYLIATHSKYYFAKSTFDPTAVPNLVPVGINETISTGLLPQKKKPLSKGALAGIVIACVVGAALAVLGILWMVRNRKRNGAVKKDDQISLGSR
jgi:hypothetical protein